MEKIYEGEDKSQIHKHRSDGIVSLSPGGKGAFGKDLTSVSRSHKYSKFGSDRFNVWGEYAHRQTDGWTDGHGGSFVQVEICKNVFLQKKYFFF